MGPGCKQETLYHLFRLPILYLHYPRTSNSSYCCILIYSMAINRSQSSYCYHILVLWGNKFMHMLIVLLSTNPLEKIGSVYPLYVYDRNRPLAPLLRQKMALSGVWCFYWLLMFDVYGIKILEQIYRIRTEHLSNNMNTEQKYWNQ